MNRKKLQIVLGSLVAGVLLLGLLVWRPGPGPSANAAKSAPRQLLVYCAAGLKPPVEAIAREYQEHYGVAVEIQYGGSGTLLSNLRVARRGDLFLAADGASVDAARSNHLIAEVVPLARLAPVAVVPRANPKNLRTLDDLIRPDVALALASPEAAAVGRFVQDRLRTLGRWDAVAARARVFKPTVGEIANDVKLGAADAGFVWDATVRQYPELAALDLAEFSGLTSEVAACVLASTEQPRAALHFARYLAARDRGQQVFRKSGFTPVDGDRWEESPEVVLYSGGVNRIAIEDTLRRFEEREGARVTRVYNGCGILVAQMKAGQRPDAYFACDVSFMREVQPLFRDSDVVARTRVVILTRKGNPRNLRDLPDLAQPGLRLGVANAEQSALGALTDNLLRQAGVLEKVRPNVAVQTPTADLLVNQMRAGALDAAVVYRANTSQVGDTLDIIELAQPAAVATQPYAIGRASERPQLMRRLQEALRSADSRQCFERAGFQWIEPVAAHAP